VVSGGTVEANRQLNLRSPIYRPTAAYGHFGRKPARGKVGGASVNLFPWEKSDRVDALKKAVR